MTKVFLTEDFDGEGNLTRIVATDHKTGDHVLDFLWDPRDEQNPANRAEFRSWVNTMLKRKNIAPIN